MISPRGTATRNGRRSADLPVVSVKNVKTLTNNPAPDARPSACLFTTAAWPFLFQEMRSRDWPTKSIQYIMMWQLSVLHCQEMRSRDWPIKSFQYIMMWQLSVCTVRDEVRRLVNQTTSSSFPVLLVRAKGDTELDLQITF